MFEITDIIVVGLLGIPLNYILLKGYETVRGYISSIKSSKPTECETQTEASQAAEEMDVMRKMKERELQLAKSD
jgi:ribosomal protein L14E/L6E/L27E